MQIDETGVAGRLRVAIGHADDGGFLQAQHIIDVVGPVVEERQFGRAGIAEHFLDAEGAQQDEGRVLDGDRGCRRSGWFAGRHRLAPKIEYSVLRGANSGIRPFRDGASAPDPESRDSGFDAAHRPGMTSSFTTSPCPSSSAGRPNSRSTIPCRRGVVVGIDRELAALEQRLHAAIDEFLRRHRRHAAWPRTRRCNAACSGPWKIRPG